MSRDLQRRADELEADIKQRRAHLDQTLHELESRLSPEQLKRNVVDLLPRSSNGNNFFNNLGRSIRENPIPVLVSVVGLSWLVVSQVRSAQRQPATSSARLPLPGGSSMTSRQAAPQHMVATHLGTQQGRGGASTHRPDVVGEATHLGTGQGWRGYVYPSS